MAMLKSERATLVATLFFEIPVAESLKMPYRRQFLVPGVPSRDQKGSGDSVREPNEGPKGPEVHPEEPPGCPRRSSEDQFGGGGNLKILSFMLRKSIVFDLWHFAGSGRSRDLPREGPGDVSASFWSPAPQKKPLKRTS